MKDFWKNYIIYIVVGFFSLNSVLHAEPEQADLYVVVSGGMVNIPPGSFVEGSSRYGGIQPDYYIDYDSPEMKEVIEFGDSLYQQKLPIWTRVQKVINYVQKRFPRGDYDDPGYLKTSNTYRRLNQNVPLSKYLVCGAGVCREHALVTHFVLKAAGIPNHHVYAKVSQAGHVEDHAFTVIEVEGKKWVVDPYNSNFNGTSLKDLMSKKGVSAWNKRAPIGQRSITKVSVKEINPFPRVWIHMDHVDETNENVSIPDACDSLSFRARN